MASVNAPSASSTKTTVVSGSPKSKFNDFGLDYAKLLSDDYNADKTLTVKYTGKGSTFNVAAKGVLAYPKEKKADKKADDKKGDEKKEDKKDPVSLDAPKPEVNASQPKEAVKTDSSAGNQPAAKKDEPAKQEFLIPSTEVKVITNVEGRNIETRFDASGIRTWADLGTYKIWKDLNITTKLKTTSEFNKATGWVAAEYNGGHCNAIARLELKKENVPFFNEKVVITHGDFKVGLQAKINLKDFTFRRHNFFVNYHHRDFDLWAEHITNTDRPQFKIGTLVAAAAYRLNKHTFVAKGTWDTEKFGATLGFTTKVNDKTNVRAKVDWPGVLSVAARYTHCKSLGIVVGTQLNLREFDKNIKTNRAISFPVGLTVEFTYN